MKAGIIAAGRGERLRDATRLKPLAQIGHSPLIAHVLAGLTSAGASEVCVIINEESLAIRRVVEDLQLPLAFHWLIETTPSSMHSFLRVLETLASMGEDGPFLIATTDTILPANAWREFWSAAAQRADAVTLAINQPAPDDNPLWVRTDERGRVIALGPDAQPTQTATAGIYVVRPIVLREAAAARRAKVASLRAFLTRLLTSGSPIGAVTIGSSIDVDRPADIVAAERMLQSDE